MRVSFPAYPGHVHLVNNLTAPHNLSAVILLDQ
jgi:hypothetical protein